MFNNNLTILVLYYSKYGSTRILAELIAQGIDSVSDCNARLRTVPKISPVTTKIHKSDIPLSGSPYVELVDLEECDALALGSPTYFGNMAAPLKYFFDSTTLTWLSGTLVGKPACVFTTAGTINGGQESTLLSMMIPLLHHGMLLLGLPYTQPELMHSKTTGCGPYGASHCVGINNKEIVSNETRTLTIALGRRLAKTTIKLHH